MSKFLKNSVAFIMALSICSVTTMAAESVQFEVNSLISSVEQSATPRIIDLSGCERVEVDAEGNIIPQSRQALKGHTIRGGSTMYYYQSGTTRWNINRGKTMSLSATLKNSGQSWACGFEGGGYDEIMDEGRDSSIEGKASCPADGKYRFYIKNYSSDSITVESGSILY